MMYLGADFTPVKSLVQELLASKSQSSSPSFSPLPSKSDLNTDSGLSLLNSCLQSSPFLGGLQPSSTDSQAFSCLGSQPGHFSHPHLSRWYHRINAMSGKERSSLPPGKGVLQATPAPISPMDRWILSRMAYATEQVNIGFKEYNFPQATTALYNFWLYELCDVYLEYLKPIFQGTDSSAALTARNVLYTCLDGGLRLISPFMPYISEELFQRLPRWSAKEPPSIMVTPFPTSTNTPYRDTAIEAEVELVQKIVGVVRSTRADYNIPNKTKTQLFLKVFCPDTSSTVKKFTSTVATLAYSKQVEVVDSPPSGCAIVTVNDKITAHLVLKGLVDPAKEIEKLTKKRALLQQTMEKLLKAVKVPDYLTKVPEDVRKANQEKIEQSEVEIARLGDAMAALANIEA